MLKPIVVKTLASVVLLAVFNTADAKKVTPSVLSDAQKQELTASLERARKTFDVPGMAMAIVKDGKVIYAEGSGLREIKNKKPVTPDTLFAIASNTKAFTATALAMLADEGKLNFNDRVIEHLPWFEMSDPYITREMRVIDLLAHRSGLSLGAGDLLYWPGTEYSTEEVARRLKQVPIKGGFRQKYAYDNILYGVAQLVIEAASGETFEDFLQKRVFNPINMSDTRFNADYIKSRDEVATGYSKADFKDLVPAPRMTWHNVSGAGGIYSSVNDMAKWMNLQLAHGKYKDKQIFSKKNQAQLWNVLTPIPVREPSLDELKPMKPNYAGYGGAFVLTDYRGKKLVWHTGGWPGMVSRMTLIPDENLGVVVLTNAESGAAFHSVTLEAIDTVLGNPEHDWINAYHLGAKKSSERAKKAVAKHEEKRAKNTKPSLLLKDYTGRYHDKWYGDVLIEKSGKNLAIQFEPTKLLKGTLEHWHHNTFVARWEQRWLNADSFVTFEFNHDGEVTGFNINPVNPKTDFSFDFHDLELKKVKEKKNKEKKK